MDNWSYIFGDFARQFLPLDDEMTIKVQRINASEPDTITVR